MAFSVVRFYLQDSAEKMDVEENNDESAEVKKSKKRKAKEPADEEPKSKKPMKGYFRWLHGPDSGKAKYRTENPDASKEDEKDALKAAWASLSEEDKMALDTSYEEEMKAWEEAHPEEVAAAKAKEDEKAATKQAKADADAAKDKRPLSGYFRFMNEFRPKSSSPTWSSCSPASSSCSSVRIVSSVLHGWLGIVHLPHVRLTCAFGHEQREETQLVCWCAIFNFLGFFGLEGGGNDARSAYRCPVMPSHAQSCPVKMRASASDFFWA